MKNLSKSQYTRGLQCAKSLWLYREKPELRDTPSPEQQAIFDAGTEVGVLAQSWISGGVLIKADHTDPERALLQTATSLVSGIQVIYEAAFLHDDVLVRADIIKKNADGSWDLYEVKSTTKLEDTHLDDVAIQRYVLAGAGLKLRRAHLAHLDSSYVRQGPLDLARLFLAEDVTTQTEGLLDTVPAVVARMKQVAAAAEAPARDIGANCSKPHDCDFIGHCWAKVPDYSVWNLAGAIGKKKAELWHDGIKTIKDINPEKTKLTDYQKVQVAVAKTGQPHIDVKAIRAFLDTLVYPIHHLDFEAVNPAIPPYDGTRPYQAIPTQASLHVQQERGAPVLHHEYVGDGTTDPRPELIQFLMRHIGPVGSVLAYHKSYEGTCLKGLAAYAPQAGHALLAQEARLWDPAEPFKKAWYHHPGFLGKWSIKNVLPVLVPDLSYAGLAIQNGAEAMRAYAEMMRPETTPERRAQLAADLKVYCGFDTTAMVRILDHLYEITGAKVTA